MATFANPCRDVEIRSVLAHLQADTLVIERILELGGTLVEIREAVDVDGAAPCWCDPPASSDRVAEIRALLGELLEPRQRTEPTAASVDMRG